MTLRVCPFCRGWIKGRARRCRHCRRWIHHLRTLNLNFNLDLVQVNLGQGTFWDSSLFCPKCEHQNTATATKCERCGRGFHQTPEIGPSGWVKVREGLRNLINSSDRECPYCAEDIPQSAQVCPHCRVRFEG